jgi:hypothetical protein
VKVFAGCSFLCELTHHCAGGSVSKQAHIEIHYRTTHNWVSRHYTVSEETLREAAAWVNEVKLATGYRPRATHLDTWLMEHHARLDCIDGPASMEITLTGDYRREEWYRNGKLYRENGPVLVEFEGPGDVSCLRYHEDVKQQRAPPHLNPHLTIPGVKISSRRKAASKVRGAHFTSAGSELVVVKQQEQPRRSPGPNSGPSRQLTGEQHLCKCE